jgi:cytochrome c biogenesis protein CcdA
MKPISKPFLYLLLSLAIMIPLFSAFNASPQIPSSSPIAAQINLTPMAPAGPQTGQSMDETKNQIFFFYAKSCSHCQAIYNDILSPFIDSNKDQVQLWALAVDNPANYEALIEIEEEYNVQSADRGLPTILIGDHLLIGEEQCLSELPDVLNNLLGQSEIILPIAPGVDITTLNNEAVSFVEDIEMCTVDDPEACTTGEPIYAAYFYQVGCKECSRAEADLIYLQSKFPNLIIEEFNIYDEAAMGEWLADQAGRADDFHSPALFINNHAWIGDEEITPQAIREALEAYNDSGAERYWADYDPNMDNNSLIERFESMGWITVVVAGLIDGLNPCAFATLIFFISYLTISGRKGKEIILVGVSFTLGVFIAYLVIGMGFYKVLDLLGNWLKIVGQWVIGLTGVLCLVLAFFALRDFFKARKGDIGDMTMNLPHGLRMRINKVIRSGKNSRFFIGGAFITGLIISFLELACTGQIYLPTIIFVSSIPELQLQAFTYLIIYNLLFITPLIVVFVLAYYGTTSKDLTAFLQKNAAKVKLGMVFLFSALGIWMILSIIS